LMALILFSIPARAQLQQPFVFAVDPVNSRTIDVFTRNDLTGVLTRVAGSPFPSKESVNVMTIDFKGRFLFTASYNPSNVSMFTIDPNTGALQEVTNSPFASTATNQPVFLSAESSGQFLYVINFNGSQPGASSIETFQIDTGTPGLVPSTGGPTKLPGLFLNGATHPSGKSFYAVLNIPNVAVPNEASFLLFNGTDGTFTTPSLPLDASTIGTFDCCFGLDPQGLHLAIGTSGSLVVYGLQTDGTIAPGTVADTIQFNGEAFSMSFDPLGHFLYADILNPAVGPTHAIHFYSVAALQESTSSPLPGVFPFPQSWNIDTTAPLIYADQVYQVDSVTGIPAAIIAASPLSSPSPSSPRAIFSQPPGSQPVVGPVATLSATSFFFGSLSVGQSSGAQTLTITSSGGQALSLNTLAITGTNPGDFTESDTCHVPTALQPNTSCSVLITFAPTAAGSRSASLTITDNASPSSESAQLNGTGLTPAPAVALVPGSLDFGTTNVGTNTPMSVTVTNTGTAALHISSVALSGANQNDFTFSDPTCNVAVPVNASCTIIFTFTPLAAGLRTASATITDDAPDAPQFLNLKGNANALPTAAVAVNPSSPDFGTTTQGTTTPMSVAVKNVGGAPLHITNVVLGGANATEFSFSDPTCSVAIPVSGTCTIVVNFAPLVTGVGLANLTLTDDAPDSPQVINIRGAANSAFTAGPAPGGATTVSVSAGQTAQFQLQLTPGAGFVGNVGLSCSGAPANATCMVPGTVAVASGATTPFTVSVSTSGPAMLPPSIPWRVAPLESVRVLLLLAVIPILTMAIRYRWILDGGISVRPLTRSGALCAILLVSVIYVTGCGSVSSTASTTPTPPPPAPPPAVTPSGTFTIVVTPAATSSTGQPLPLTPIQLTLTVK
jgi:hypothetical protein